MPSLALGYTATQKSTGALLCFNYSPENRVPPVILTYSFLIMEWKELKSLPITGVADLTNIFGNTQTTNR